MRGLLALGVLAMIVPIATFVLAAMLTAKLLSLPVILRWPAQPGLARLRTIALRRALLARRSSHSERRREG
jgi:hypothetical protein